MPTTLDRPQSLLITKEDRCDGCGAAAAARVTTSDLGVFHFCGHCYARHREALKPRVTQTMLKEQA